MFAQHRVGDRIQFEVIDVSTAINAAREHARFKEQLIKGVKTLDADLTERLLTNNLISGVSEI